MWNSSQPCVISHSLHFADVSLSLYFRLQSHQLLIVFVVKTDDLIFHSNRFPHSGAIVYICKAFVLHAVTIYNAWYQSGREASARCYCHHFNHRAFLNNFTNKVFLMYQKNPKPKKFSLFGCLWSLPSPQASRHEHCKACLQSLSVSSHSRLLTCSSMLRWFTDVTTMHDK